jgi:GT2 family glycosyltransferase
MDDDAFPTLKWMNNFEAYIKKYKNSILQFALIDKIGIISWETKIYKLDRFSFGFLASLLNNLFMKRYEASSTKYLKLKNKTPVKIHAACFSTVFIPLKIIEEGLRIECKKENVMYSEDADFCYNALMRGYHTYQVPNKTIHLHGLTKTKKDYSKIDKYNYSYMWLYSKWFCNNEFLKKLKEEDLIVNRLVFLKLLRNRLKHIILRLLLKLKNQKRVSRKIVEILR